MPEPPRRRPGSGPDPPEPDGENTNTKPVDIGDVDTAYLVPPEPLQGIRASRDEQMVAHQAAADHLRSQQQTLVRQIVDWQDVMYAERSADCRAKIQQQIDRLWEAWSEMEQQGIAHERAVRALRQPDPPLPPEEQGG